MKAKLTARLLNSLEITGKEYEIHDTTVPGLFIRVTAKGAKSYVVTWARGRKKTLGRVGVLTLEQARTQAGRYLTEAREHGEPLAVTHGQRRAGIPSLQDFLDDSYEPWTLTHHKDGKRGCDAIRASFAEHLHLRLDELTLLRMEKLRSDWIAKGLKPSTANRSMVRIKGLLSRAVDWGVLTEHPLAKLKPLKEDKSKRVRYLLPDEEKRLTAALDAREERIRAERDSGNAWRQARKRPLLPDLRQFAFADHLKPLVLLSLNTGLRQGEAFNLQWADVDLVQKVLTVEGEGAKSHQTRHIPLNGKAVEALTAWREQNTTEKGYLFPGEDGGRLDNVNTAWRAVLKDAEITGFRWHDLRHTFASWLVMRGVPLNTVRDLMGHADIATTLRYAHLAPDVKAQAVELI